MIKSLTTRVEVDIAKKVHRCRRNHRHVIKRGDSRLKVRNGRSWLHYCAECGKTIVLNDIKKLEALASTLETSCAFRNELPLRLF